MVAKLAIGLLLMAVFITAVAVAAFWYFRERDRLDHEERVQRREMEHEERMEMFDDDDL